MARGGCVREVRLELTHTSSWKIVTSTGAVCLGRRIRRLGIGLGLRCGACRNYLLYVTDRTHDYDHHDEKKLVTEVGTTDEIVELTLAKRSSVCRLSRAIEGLWKSDDEMLSLKT